MVKISKKQVSKAISELIGLRVKLFVTLDMLEHMDDNDLELIMVHMIMADVDDILNHLGFDAETIPDRFSAMANYLNEKDYKEIQAVLKSIGNFDMEQWIDDSSKLPN